jgi:hypothetical protein
VSVRVFSIMGDEQPINQRPSEPRDENRPLLPARERCAPRADLDFLPHKYFVILCEPLTEEGYFVWPLTKSPMTFGFREREGQKPL